MSRKKKEPVEENTVLDAPEGGAPEESVAPETEQTGETGETFVLTAEQMREARERIEALQREKDETFAMLQRNQADFDNFRRRNATVRADSFEDGKRECIRALLPVLDNFDRAMENDASADEAWREGVKLVHRQLLDTLAKLGMEEVETDGKFDPNFHEAVMQEAADGVESGTITMVFQKGYRVGERIIRHSMVKVAE